MSLRIVLAVCLCLLTPVHSTFSASPPDWAFSVADPVQPTLDETTPRSLPGSDRNYTLKQVDDLSNPPDWFPSSHAPMPGVVAKGGAAPAFACAACHLTSGFGHPESANLAGLPLEYLNRQMAEFRSGARREPTRMNAIARSFTEEQIKEASAWFAAISPRPWVRVVESDNVPHSFVNRGRMRMPFPGDGTEPLGERIVELPEDRGRAELRDPTSGFVAYVPAGSIERGRALAETGGEGRTVACAGCHGPALLGLSDTPRLAGLSPLYVARQLSAFQSAERDGAKAGAMRATVERLSSADILALSAYVASLSPLR